MHRVCILGVFCISNSDRALKAGHSPRLFCIARTGHTCVSTDSHNLLYLLVPYFWCSVCGSFHPETCPGLCLQLGAARLTILGGEIQVTQSPQSTNLRNFSPSHNTYRCFKTFFSPCANDSANVKDHIPHTHQNYDFPCLIFLLC